MDFATTLPALVDRFDSQNLHYALIGGLAMALRGVQRTTLDANFILFSDDLDACHAILETWGYQRDFHSENISHYNATDPILGHIDLLHAFRPATLGMLKRAERIPLTATCSIPVVHIEDLIGLKIQAACNDPRRAIGDWADIQRLVQHAGHTALPLDWELLGDYLALFDQSHHLPSLQDLHGTPHAS